MISAFGVDHGDISKGLRLVRVPKGLKAPGGRRPTGAQLRTRGTNPGAPTRSQKVGAALNRAGEADISLKGIGAGVGSTTSKVGGFLSRHPGLTGTAAVGGGGAAGYRYLSRKEPKR